MPAFPLNPVISPPVFSFLALNRLYFVLLPYCAIYRVLLPDWRWFLVVPYLRRERVIGHTF